MMDWSTLMLEGLLEARQLGEQDFPRAWRRATRRAEAAGVRRPRDFTATSNEEDEGWLPFSTFFRKACEREWCGRVHTDFLNLRGMLEDSGLEGRHVGNERVLLIA